MIKRLSIWLIAGYSSLCLANDRLVCKDLKTQHQNLCGSEKTLGPCLLKDDKATKEALLKLRWWPELTAAEQTNLKEFQKKKKPKKAEIAVTVALLSKGCSNERYELWISTLKTLRSLKSERLNIEARAVLRDRLARANPPNPGLLSLLMDQATLDDAQDVEIIKPTPEARKEFKSIREESRSQQGRLTAELLAAAYRDKGDSDHPKSPANGKMEDMNFDPVQIQQIIAKEFALAKGLREKTNAWAAKNGLGVSSP